MIRIVIVIILFFPFYKSYSQGADTIVVNLNVRSITVKSFASFLKNHDSDPHFSAYLKYRADYRDGNIPNDNANVNIDTVKTVVLIDIYRYLRFNVSTQTAFADFHSSVQSKRNTNNFLDAQLDLVDAEFLAGEKANTDAGGNLLTGTPTPQP